MAGNERNLHPLPEEAFRRYDETPDEEFYLLPRFVTHIDDRAIAAVTQLYRELFPAGGEILDLMSSWISHLPPEAGYRRVIGLGMNEAELRRNERLDAYVIQNLNRTPDLPFDDAEFDGCGICVSIDYLTSPVAVLREVGRVLKVGAPVVITFSNECLPKRQPLSSPPAQATPASWVRSAVLPTTAPITPGPTPWRAVLHANSARERFSRISCSILSTSGSTFSLKSASASSGKPGSQAAERISREKSATASLKPRNGASSSRLIAKTSDNVAVSNIGSRRRRSAEIPP